MVVLKNLFDKKKNQENLSGNELVDDQQKIIDDFQSKFRIRFYDPDLIIHALKHRSYLNVTNEGRIASNERLEFLGDAVLDLVVTHHLFQKFPKRTEGQLSKIKSILVSKTVLAEIASDISLGTFLLMNKGEEKSGGRKRQSILADCFEAIIGAIYIDQGLEEATKFIRQNLLEKFKSIMQRELSKNYKSILLEFAQSRYNQLPEYRIVKETGPDHAKRFVVAAYLEGKKIGTGKGKSKKIAEQDAAKRAIERLGLEDNSF